MLTANEISSPLTPIINVCFYENIFARNWEISRLSPVPNVNNPKYISDYRATSILLILSKVYERLILDQILDHIRGYRKGHYVTDE